MSQDMWLLLFLKIVLIAAEASIIGFVAVYTGLAPWWRNSLGRSIVAFALLIASEVLIVILSLFLNFNRLTSHVAGWLQIAIFALVTPVMIWRALAFIRIRRAREDPAAGAAQHLDAP